MTGFKGIASVLTSWPGQGKPNEWGPDTVLVLDTITSLGRWIMNHVLSLNARLGQAPQLQDWGMAMSLQEDLIAMLCSESIKCHVLVLAHIAYAQPEGELMTKGYPSALGNKLPPKIGQYFNSTLYMKSVRQGTVTKRMIYTDTVGMIECKTSAPGQVKKEYPIETGLADYFADLGHSPKA